MGKIIGGWHAFFDAVIKPYEITSKFFLNIGEQLFLLIIGPKKYWNRIRGVLTGPWPPKNLICQKSSILFLSSKYPKLYDFGVKLYVFWVNKFNKTGFKPLKLQIYIIIEKINNYLNAASYSLNFMFMDQTNKMMHISEMK